MDKYDETYNSENEMEERDTITLTLEDNSEIECEVLAIFPYSDKEYIALLPQDSGEDGEIYLYQFVQLENDEIDLINIEDDDEFEAVSDAFDELMDSEEFDELFGEEEFEEDSEEEEEKN